MSSQAAQHKGEVARAERFEFGRAPFHATGRRGMNRWRDIIDWLGGYPYEYASTDVITAFHEARGFHAERVVPTGGLGCNEFVFVRNGEEA
jgi:hypothetical protein